MTEAEWLVSNEPDSMLCKVESAPTRKLRLLACALCRRVWAAMRDERGHEAVRAVERFADGDLDPDELEAAFGDAAEEAGEHYRKRDEAHTRSMVAATVAAQQPLGTEDISECLECALDASGRPDEPEAQADLFRDIFGNPFRPVGFDPRWRTDAVLAAAGRMYEGLDFSAMPVLAEALQDAGCDNADVLDHCRGSGPHVRGCWVVDLVLGKE
jgi:hypothetical protein